MQDNQSNQSSTPKSQSEMDTILRGTKWTSQSDANASLQKHGFSAVLKENNSAEIYDGTKKVASVQFDPQKSGQINGITY